MALVNNWFQRRRAFAINLGYIGTELGGAIMTPLIALLVFEHGWRTAAVLSGILVPLVYIPLSFFIRNRPEEIGLRRDGDNPHPSGEREPASPLVPRTHDADEFGVKEAMKTGAFWHLSIAMGFRLFSKSGLQIHLVPLMVWKGIDEITAAALVGLFAFTQVPVRLGAAWVADRWSMTGPEGSLWTCVAFVLLFALAESGNLVSWALIGDFYGRTNFATLRGALSFVHSPMSLPAPIFLGWVFDSTQSYTLALIPVAGSYVAGCVLYLMLRRPHRTAPMGAGSGPP
jgi:sugar phosphate permease